MSDSTQYLVRWLCHDLATPIASVMTASELLDETPDAEITELIQYGARRLSGRLRLVRLALGAAEAAMAGSALERLVREGLDGTTIDWMWSGDAVDGMATLVANSALLVADLNRTKPLTVTGSGVVVQAGCTWPDSVAAVFSGAPASCNRGAVAAMLMQNAATAGKKITINNNGLTWH